MIDIFHAMCDTTKGVGYLSIVSYGELIQNTPVI